MANKKDVTRKLQANRRVGELAAARRIPGSKQRLKTITRLVRTWIDRSVLEQEPALQQMAWVEYRYMQPLQRTELFARVYFETYIELYRELFPEGDATKKQPIDIDFVRNAPGVMNALWAARAAADALGVPYDVYCRVLMRAHVVDDKWNQLPRPNQMYGKLAGPRLRDALTTDLLAERLYAPGWNPKFKAAAYTGDPVQEAALGLMAEVVNTSADPAGVLAEYLCGRQVITEPRAVDTFGQAMVDDAKTRQPGKPVVARAEPKPIPPACIGFPNPVEDSPCVVCPVVHICLALAREVQQELIEATGSDDPRREWKRHRNKLRQRRFREKNPPAKSVNLWELAQKIGWGDDE